MILCTIFIFFIAEDMCHIDDIPKITGVLEEFIPGKNGCEVFKKWVNISSDGLRRLLWTQRWDSKLFFIVSNYNILYGGSYKCPLQMSYIEYWLSLTNKINNKVYS